MVRQSQFSVEVVSNFLNALIDEKINLDSLIDSKIVDKFEDSLFTKGKTYDVKTNENVEIIFDKEIFSIMNEKQKEIIIDLNRSN